MATELDSHLKFCWDVVKRDRETYSPSFREFLDKVFLKRLEKCNFISLEVDDIESDLKHIAQTIDEIKYTGQETEASLRT